MLREECRYVAEYLKKFGESRAALDLDKISDHVKRCQACHDTMAEFFRTMPVSETEYLDETLDDLTSAIYNLVKSLIKNPQGDGQEHENVRFLSEPGDASQYVQEGSEMIDDVQDFTGADQVRGESMEGLRHLMSQCQLGLAMQLLQKGLDLDARHSLDCANLMGVLQISNNQLEDADRSFRRVVTASKSDVYARSVQVHSMTNLAYVYQLRGDLDSAIKWAGRAKALAEELGVDHFNSSFSLMYFYLLRNGPADVEACQSEVEALTSQPDSRREFQRCMALGTNAEILALYRSRGLAGRFPL